MSGNIIGGGISSALPVRKLTLGKIPIGQRVLVIQYTDKSGIEKTKSMNEDWFIDGEKAVIGTKVALNPKTSSSLAQQDGLVCDGTTKYSVVDVGLILGVKRGQVFFSKELEDCTKGSK